MNNEPQLASSEFGEQAFYDAVDKIKNYILEGDVMQVVLSQRLVKNLLFLPLALYRVLRSINPSPYMFFYHLDDHYIVGASPEILVRLENNKVTVEADCRNPSTGARFSTRSRFRTRFIK